MIFHQVSMETTNETWAKETIGNRILADQVNKPVYTVSIPEILGNPISVSSFPPYIGGNLETGKLMNSISMLFVLPKSYARKRKGAQFA